MALLIDATEAHIVNSLDSEATMERWLVERRVKANTL